MVALAAAASRLDADELSELSIFPLARDALASGPGGRDRAAIGVETGKGRERLVGRVAGRETRSGLPYLTLIKLLKIVAVAVNGLTQPIVFSMINDVTLLI